MATGGKLTDALIRDARPGITSAGKATPRPYKMGDAGGLFLEVTPAGGKLWRLKYRFHGKEKRISLGIYPAVSLADARQLCDQARRLLVSGLDPSVERRQHRDFETSLHAAAEQASRRVRITLATDGAFEVWKGRAVIRLDSAEAVALRDLLDKLIAAEVIHAPD